MCARKINLAEMADAVSTKAPAPGYPPAAADPAAAPASTEAAASDSDHATVRNARRAVGLPQVSFARVINTPIALLNDWEQGRQNPPGAAVRLCELLIKNPDLIKQFD